MENNYRKTQCCGTCKYIEEHGIGEYEDYMPFYYCQLTMIKTKIETGRYAGKDNYDNDLEFDQLGICDKYEPEEES